MKILMKCISKPAFFTLLLTISGPAMAYVGPGLGLSALGALIAFVAAILVAIFGFLWFPLRRILRKKKNAEVSESDKVERGDGDSDI